MNLSEAYLFATKINSGLSNSIRLKVNSACKLKNSSF